MVVFTTLIAAAVASAATPTLPTEAQPTVRVATHDLDLSSVAGQRVLDLRVARAAAHVCNTVDPRYASGVRVAQRQCREATIATARTRTAPIRIVAR